MPHRTSEYHPFRAVLGLIALFAGIAGLIGLYTVEIPEGNRQPLLVALGVVLGWGSSVVQSEFGSTTTGRKLAEAAADRAVNSASAANERERK